MKKLLLASALLAFSSTSFADTWTCYRYVDGGATGGSVKVSANSKSEAERKAYAKYKKLGYRLDHVECK